MSETTGVMDSIGCRAPTQTRYPFVMNEVPAEFQKKAQDQLGETPEIREKKLKELREMIEKDDEIDINWMTDDFLLIYLRGRKFDLKRAFHSLKRLVAFVKAYKSVFTVSPFAADTFIHEKMAYFLPQRDPDGCAVYVGFLDRWNPSVVSPDDVMPCHMLCMTKALTYPMTQVNGFKVIHDTKSSSLKHFRVCTPHFAYLVCCLFQEIWPAGFKGFHVINASLLFRTFFTIISPILPKKLRSRVFVHSNLSSLHKHFPTDILPKEFGGTLEENDFPEWAKKARHPEPIYRILNSS